MTIASLLIISLVFLVMGWTTGADNKILLLFATVIVSGIAMAGGYIQSQKATFIIGGSQKTMQINFLIASVIGVFVVSGVIMLLEPTYAGGTNAAQANLMATLSQGVLIGELPWELIFVGVFGGIVLGMLRLPIMTVAIGFYLPVSTVAIIFTGALVATIIKYLNKKDEHAQGAKEKSGMLLGSGLVVGGALMGLIGMILSIVIPSGNPFYIGLTEGSFAASNFMSILLLMILIVVVFTIIQETKTKKQ